MLTALAIDGYRSIRQLRLALGRITVVTGPNGSGKSSLYRALRLLAGAGRDGAVAALAREGGLNSTLWAGPEKLTADVKSRRAPAQGLTRSGPVALRMGFASDGFGYAMDLGLPQPATSMFGRDPEIKAEAVWHGPSFRPAASLAERTGAHVRLRDDGGWQPAGRALAPWESMLDEIDSPEVRAVRGELRGWRFYDAIRTDPESPVRLAEIGTRTPVLASDARDLAAAIQTIRELGDRPRLDAAIAEAFPGSRIDILDHDGRFEIALTQQNLLRPLRAAELSDGTLRYLVWVAALLSPRPAGLIVLNEPETSLHPDLLAPLARLITAASEDSQVLVVSHATPIVDALSDAGAVVAELDKTTGETTVVGQRVLDEPPWHWPSR